MRAPTVRLSSCVVPTPIFGIPPAELRDSGIVNAPADAVEIRCTYDGRQFAKAVVKTRTGEREFIVCRSPFGLVLDLEQRASLTSQPLPVWYVLWRYANQLFQRLRASFREAVAA